MAKGARIQVSTDSGVQPNAVLVVAQVTAALAAARLNDDSAVEAIQRLTHAIVPLVHQFAVLATEAQIHKSERLREEARAVDKVLFQLFRRGQTGGILRADLPAAWVVHACSGLLHGVAMAARRGDIAP